MDRRGFVLLAAGTVAAGAGAFGVLRDRSPSDAFADGASRDGAALRLQPGSLFVFGHSWAAGAHVRRYLSWPNLVAAKLGLPPLVLYPHHDLGKTTNFATGGARATGTKKEGGAGYVLQALPNGPDTPPELILLLTGDLDIGFHKQSLASRRMMGGGINAALGRLLATEIHEEDDPDAWSFDGSWSSDTGDQVNSGSGVTYSLQDGATFTVQLPASYDGRPVTIGLPLWDLTVSGLVDWSLDGRSLGRRTDLTAMRNVLTSQYPRATYAERFDGLPSGAHALQGRWSSAGKGSAVVVDYWSLERRGVQIVCELMPDENPWGNHFGGVTTVSNRANREALKPRSLVTYVDLTKAVNPTGTARDKRFWDSDKSSHPTPAGERAIADLVTRAIRRIRVPA